MKPRALLVLALGLGFGGCASSPKQTPSDRSPVMENSRDFDAYVERRTDDLLRMGATKDRREASTQAEVDAERRFGPRVPTDSASWTWTPRKDRSPTTAELDDALGKAR